MSTFRLQAPNGDIIHLDCATGKIYVAINRPEAQGKFELEPEIYGYRVRVEGVSDAVNPDATAGSIGLLDFFHASQRAEHEDDHTPGVIAQFVIDDPRTNDSVGRVRWYAHYTEVDFELGVTATGQGVYGYSQAPNAAWAMDVEYGTEEGSDPVDSAIGDNELKGGRA